MDDAIDHYLEDAGEAVALRFVDALEGAFRHIADHPASGPALYAFELDLQGVRVWPVGSFPHLVFVFERADHIDVWRVLHSKRDVASWLLHEDERPLRES